MKVLGRSLLDVALVHGLLGWLYTAAWAAVRPEDLSAQLNHWVPVRRDTFGTVCFAASALAFFILAVGQRRPWMRGTSRGGPTNACLRTLVFYPLLVWAYLGVNSLIHPWTIDRPLTHFSAVPTESTAAIVCFAVSAVALLALRLRAPGTWEGTSHG